ncbi:hypothetical protein [Niabella aquatica]
MGLGNRRIETYERKQNVNLKIAVTIVFLTVMVGVLIVFIVLCFTKDKGTEKIVLGVIEFIMVNAIRPLAKHFFPAMESPGK